MLGHPKGLFMLFCTEMWERFGFYGMRAILVLYMIGGISTGGLGWSDAEALQLYGTYLGLSYIMPLLGGWIADRYIGQRASILFGGSVIAVGHFLMTVNELWSFYLALGCITVGTGFLKPCATSMLGGLYAEKDSRRDSAYSIFYMGINVGSLFGTFIAGWLKMQYGYSWGFAAAGFGMVIGLVIFALGAKSTLGDVGLRRKPLVKTAEVKQPLIKLEKSRMGVIFILAVIQVLYVIAYEQAGGLLTIYTERYTDRVIAGWEVPSSWFAGLNPLFIILLAPLLSAIWVVLGKKGKDLSCVNKFAVGFLLTGLAFALMVWTTAELQVNSAFKTSTMLMVVFYAIYTVGELLFFPVFWSTVSRLASPRHISLLMAVALSSIGFGGKLAGTVGSYVEKAGPQQIFLGVTITMFVLGGLCFLINKKLMAKTEPDDSDPTQDSGQLSETITSNA